MFGLNGRCKQDTSAMSMETTLLLEMTLSRQDVNVKQHAIITCCINLGKMPQETKIRVEQLSGSNTMCRALVNKWHTLFQEVRVIVKDDERSDLAPCDFSLCPRLKKELKGRHFTNLKEI